LSVDSAMTTPMAALVSSTSPYASTRPSHLATRTFPISPVDPSSPFLV
jgi:hypothetical protein